MAFIDLIRFFAVTFSPYDGFSIRNERDFRQLNGLQAGRNADEAAAKDKAAANVALGGEEDSDK